MLQVDVSALRRVDQEEEGLPKKAKSGVQLAQDQKFTRMYWFTQVTRCINLSVMMEHEDDALLTTVCEVPKST